MKIYLQCASFRQRNQWLLELITDYEQEIVAGFVENINRNLVFYYR